MTRALTCGEARNLASEMLDGELATADVEAVTAHVATCKTCPGLYRAMVALRDRLRSMEYGAIPAAFASALVAALRQGSEA